MSISLFTGTSMWMIALVKTPRTPILNTQNVFLPASFIFSIIIMQEQEEKAYQHGKETKHWLPSQTPVEVLIPA